MEKTKHFEQLIMWQKELKYDDTTQLKIELEKVSKLRNAYSRGILRNATSNSSTP